MKVRHFGGLDVPLHAAELNPTTTQVEAVGEFFRVGRFQRLAGVATKEQSDRPRDRVRLRGRGHDAA
jgi:hypothetical protein